MGNSWNCIKSILLLSLVFSSIQCRNVQVENDRHQQEQENIEETLLSYYQIMSERDWPSYKRFFSEEATLTTIWPTEDSNTPQIHTNTITEFLAQTGEGPDSQPIFEEKMTKAEINIRGNLAQAWVNYEAKFGSKDSLLEWTGIDLFSFIKHNEEWKIVSLVFESE